MGSVKEIAKRWLRKAKNFPWLCKNMVVNWRLVHRYPFLKPINVWSGEPIEHYHYECTMLDGMPDGWRKAFGRQMCEEIRTYLITQPPLPDDSWYAENSKKKRKTLMDNYRLEQVKEKYGCYDEKTEVLTRSGWKYFKDITYSDEMATIGDNKLIYQKPSDIIFYKYSGKMYRLENRGVSLCVTPNHNLYVAKGSYYTDKGKRQYDFEFATPEKYFRKKKRFLKGGVVWEGERPKMFHINGHEYTNTMTAHGKTYERHYKMPDFDVDMEKFLMFLGFYVAEGYTEAGDGSGTQITLAYDPYAEKGLVSQLIEDIGFTPKEAGEGSMRFHNATLAYWLKDNCGTYAYNKRVPEFVKNLSPYLIETFLYYLYLGDGHKELTSHILATTSKQLSNDVQELILKCGDCSRETVTTMEQLNKKKKGYIKGRPITSRHEVYNINWLRTNDVETDMFKSVKERSYIEEWVDYSGMVYCVTVPTHLLYIRRNGKGVWCGNSLRWYENFTTEELSKITMKYETLSERTCSQCGKPATKITKGWILPFCDKCFDRLDFKGNYWTIEEYLGGNEI